MKYINAKFLIRLRRMEFETVAQLRPIRAALIYMRICYFTSERERTEFRKRGTSVGRRGQFGVKRLNIEFNEKHHYWNSIFVFWKTLFDNFGQVLKEFSRNIDERQCCFKFCEANIGDVKFQFDERRFLGNNYCRPFLKHLRRRWRILPLHHHFLN